MSMYWYLLVLSTSLPSSCVLYLNKHTFRTYGFVVTFLAKCLLLSSDWNVSALICHYHYSVTPMSPQAKKIMFFNLRTLIFELHLHIHKNHYQGRPPHQILGRASSGWVVIMREPNNRRDWQTDRTDCMPSIADRKGVIHLNGKFSFLNYCLWNHID